MSKYGVLLISGNRTHQESHAAVFAGHPDCRLVAVADESDVPEVRAELNRDLAGKYGIPYIPDLDEALSRQDVCIVSLCAAMERRGQVALRCAEAGKHLYLDKPLAGSVSDARAIVAAVEKAGVKAQMFSTIGSAWARKAKDALDGGRVGELKAIHAEVLFAKGKAGTVPEGTVRQEKEKVERFTFVESKREMFDIGVYALALVQWISGLRAQSVYGMTGNYIFAEHAGLDVEDFGALAIRMEGGVTATVLGGRIGWMSHPQGGPQRVDLIGTQGMLTFEAYRPRLEVYNDEPDFRLPHPHPLDPMGMWSSTQAESKVMSKKRWVALNDQSRVMAGDVAAFLRCIDQDREPEMSARCAAQLVEVIMAGYRSAAKGEEVRLPLAR